MRFSNRVVLVTGGSRGIGKATALAFAKEGAKVVVNCVKDAKAAASVVHDINELGSDAIAVKCDVASETQVKGMIAEAVKTFGRLDVLVNNAGIVFDVPFEKKTSAQFKRTIDVNLFGTWICSKYAAPHLRKTRGCIVNVSSTNGIDSFSPDSMDYDASKAGVIILTRALAQELAPRVRVNCVAPGWVDTDINAKLPKAFVQDEEKKIYVKRFGRPEEIASAIVFLASPDAGFITGSTLKVDGGYG